MRVSPEVVAVNGADVSRLSLVPCGDQLRTGAALNAVLAQRLVRRICSECKQPQEIPAEMADSLMMHGIQPGMLQHGGGCEVCRQTGYAGRLGLYELLVLDDHLRDLIASSPNVTEFRRICCERGMVTLREDGFKKVQDSLTTIEEVMRVTEATI